MGKQYVVNERECISSLAFEQGFFPETIWDHPQNAKLKELRKDPNVLLGGDVVFVPDVRTKEDSCSIDRRHRFRRRGVPEIFRLRLLKGGKPRASLEFNLNIDGTPHIGKTDRDGALEVPIPPNAKKAILLLVELGEVIKLELGCLNPADEITGAQARLANLGIYTGPIDGRESSELIYAVKTFQRRHNLPEDGLLNSETRDCLLKTHHV
jgi:hypothetical protein